MPQINKYKNHYKNYHKNHLDSDNFNLVLQMLTVMKYKFHSNKKEKKEIYKNMGFDLEAFQSNYKNILDSETMNLDHSYRASAYYNKATREISMIIAGTDITNRHDIISDLQIALSKVPDKINDIKKFHEKFKNICLKEKIDLDRCNIKIIGFSLGGVLGLMQAGLLENDNINVDNIYKFDAPGAKEILEKMEREKYFTNDEIIKSLSSKTISFNMQNNIINQTGYHIGNTKIIESQTNNSSLLQNYFWKNIDFVSKRYSDFFKKISPYKQISFGSLSSLSKGFSNLYNSYSHDLVNVIDNMKDYYQAIGNNISDTKNYLIDLQDYSTDFE